MNLRLTSMAAGLAHRGPDANGIWTDGVIGLAHTRLAVVDLTPAGAQPMTDEDGCVALVMNGEIYNHNELRRELQALGHVFKGRCDAEVMLLGFKQWGAAVFARLRGMFAAALWDRRRRRLLLVRDAIGKKPLICCRFGGALFFASEMQGFQGQAEITRRAAPAALHHFLSLQYVPSPMSAFQGFQRLPPGHYLEVDEAGGESLTRWHSWPAPADIRAAAPDQAQADMLRLLKQAVERRLQADVTLGAFLSGGADSSAVVALMTDLSAAPVETFTIGFADQSFDERPYARAVADHFGTRHHEFVVEPDLDDLLPRLVRHYGEPFADSSAIPTWFLSRETRTCATVALTGDGGDETLCGYPRYDRCGRWPDQSARRYERDICYVWDQAKPLLYGESMRPCLDRSSLDLLQPYFDQAPDPQTGAAWCDLHTYLPDDLLVKTDIASMAHGLEARSPFLDQDFVEWSCGVPARTKIAGGELKHLLKSWLRTRMPADLVDRPKMGFGIPLDSWLRGRLRPLGEEMLLSTQARDRGLFDPAFVQNLWNRHLSGASNLQAPLWALIMTEYWHRVWIDPSDQSMPQA